MGSNLPIVSSVFVSCQEHEEIYSGPCRSLRLSIWRWSPSEGYFSRLDMATRWLKWRHVETQSSWGYQKTTNSGYFISYEEWFCSHCSGYQEDSVVNEFVQERRNLKSTEQNWRGHQKCNARKSFGDLTNVYCFNEITKSSIPEWVGRCSLPIIGNL